MTKYLHSFASVSLIAALGIMPGLSQASTAEAGDAAKKLTFESTVSSEDSGKLVVSGTSSLHDWEVTTGAIVGTLQIALKEDAEGKMVLAPDAPVAAKVTVPVKTLDSGKGGMDKKMYKALESKSHKESSFVLETLKPNLQESTDLHLKGEAVGKLTVTGEERWVRFPAEIKWDPKKKTVSVTGEVDLLMTDFGIDPPTALLGTLKTGNAIKVAFEWTPKLK